MVILSGLGNAWTVFCTVSSVVMRFAWESSAMELYPLVLLANEPGFYRSLLASELPLLRPNLRIMEIDPADLDATLTTLHPPVVVCSRAPTSEPPPQVAVLILHVDEIDTSLQSRDGTIVNPRLSDILGEIDRAVSASSPDPSAHG